MAQITIKDVIFKNIRNKALGTQISTILTQSTAEDYLEDYSLEQFLESNAYYKLISSLDIDWGNIQIDENTVIEDTADLINWIKSLPTQGPTGPKGDTGEFDSSDLEDYSTKTGVTELLVGDSDLSNLPNYLGNRVEPLYFDATGAEEYNAEHTGETGFEPVVSGDPIPGTSTSYTNILDIILDDEEVIATALVNMNERITALESALQALQQNS